MRYVYIVRSIAYQMREMYHDFMQTDDIVNEGVIEIMRAIERYDENRDNKFETYLSRRIRGMVIDMMRKNDWLPRNFHRDSRSIENANLELGTRLGRAPSDEELAEYLNMNVKKLQKIQRMSNMVNVLSLDMTSDSLQGQECAAGIQLYAKGECSCTYGGYRVFTGKGKTCDFPLLCGRAEYESDCGGYGDFPAPGISASQHSAQKT